MADISPRDLQRILECAILAPSADNQHRIRFSVTDGVLSIWGIEPELPRIVYRRALNLLSLGAVIENIAIAASDSGLAAVLLPESGDPGLLARIRFERQALRSELASLCTAIPLRHTNRRLRFRGPPLTAGERETLDRAVRDIPDCTLVWLQRPEQRRPIVRLLQRAESERFHVRSLHEEIFSSIRFEAGWRSSTAEGLPPGALGIEMPMRPLFTLLRHWPVMQAANALGMHHLLGFRSAALPCALAPDLLLITVKTTDDAATVNAGRALQRTWLGLTQLGRAVQPLPAAALYALPGTCQGEIPARLHGRLAAGWKRHATPDTVPLMVLRIGQAPSTVTAGRPPVDRFWLD